jgi:uncharacterized membrane protein (UPF0127 family)
VTPSRFRGLEVIDLAPGARLIRATTPLSRLRGLALLDELPAGLALHLPRCRSVHTLGMRFALDLVFLDAQGVVVRTATGVGPGRFVGCRSARSVLETRAGGAPLFLAALSRASPRAARA